MVLGDPINFVDPSGKDFWDWVQGIARTINPWHGPTNVAGLIYATTTGEFEGMRDGNFVFRNTALERGGYSRTYGDVICLAPGAPEATYQHEKAHTEQHTVLGPFYGPAHLVFQGISYAISYARSETPSYSEYNPLEWGPYDDQTPWPW